MPENPTDHREQAIDWLARAEREYPRSMEHAHTAALIANTHAVLALQPAPPSIRQL